MASEYELLRDRNVARNNAWLEANGLGGGLVPRKSVKQARSHKQPSNNDGNLVPTRMSSRKSHAVVRFEQLGDDYFNQFERDSDSDDERPQGRRRAIGKRNRTPAVYFEPPTRERVSSRPANPNHHRSVASSVGVAPPEVEGNQEFAEDAATRPIGLSSLWNQVASAGVVPVQLTDDASVKPYYAAGQKGRCPRCLDWFCVRRDGMLHKHHCREVSPQAPIAPLLPAIV